MARNFWGVCEKHGSARRFIYYFRVSPGQYFVCAARWLIFKKTDIMAESPDKNPGTMNAFTYGGFRCGVFTLCGDLFKGFLPVFLYRSGELPENPLMLSFVMAAPVLGHILPFYDIKHGGKGIAATFGCFLGLLPHWIPLCVLASIFIFFSCVVKINPNYYRTVATYILAAICTFGWSQTAISSSAFC